MVAVVVTALIVFVPVPSAPSQAAADAPTAEPTTIVPTSTVVAAPTSGCRQRPEFAVTEHADVVDARGNWVRSADPGDLFVLLDQPVDVPRRRYGAVVGDEARPGYVIINKLRSVGSVCA